MSKWRILKDDNYPPDQVVLDVWEVSHDDVYSSSMPNDGYFNSWREAMDFVDEYIEAYYLNMALEAQETYSAARAELNNEEARR